MWVGWNSPYLGYLNSWQDRVRHQRGEYQNLISSSVCVRQILNLVRRSHINFSTSRKAKELDEVKKKVKDVGIESDMSSLKKTLAELEKERAEAEKKWEEIQKQEKVRVTFIEMQLEVVHIMTSWL